MKKSGSVTVRPFPFQKSSDFFSAMFLRTWRKLHSSGNWVLSNKEHFAEFHYRAVMCSWEWNMIFEEEVINHGVITVTFPGIWWMDGRNMLRSHLRTVFCVSFLLLWGRKRRCNDICWKLLEDDSIWTYWCFCWLKRVFPFYDIKTNKIKTEKVF